MPSSSIPSYRLHKRSGQAVVSFPLGGGQYRDYYLGQHGTRQSSPASWAEYDRLVAEWLANGRCLKTEADPGMTVSEVLDAYWRFAQGHYRKIDPDTGQPTPTTQLQRVRYALDPVLELYGSTEARRFGPLALKAVRQHLVSRGLARSQVNSLAGCIKRAWAWAVSEELVPPSISEALRTVRGLERGRTEAREPDPVEPVPEALIAPVQALVLPPVRDLIELQLLTAMRPGEAVRIRPADIDRSGDVWVYRPATHKTAHHGHARTIFLGPRARTLLGPYMVRDPASYCFSPAEAMTARLKELGQAVRIRCGKRYRVDTYTHAIRRGCDRAFPPADGLPEAELAAWRKAHRWRPHRLRHNAATRLVAEFGWEVARVILGHRTLSVTRIYAAEDFQKVVEAVRKSG